jgi:Fe-Mn family superoxide dismutase
MHLNKKLIDGLTVDSILKKSVKESISVNKPSLEEAYVAEPKPFKQVSELLSQKAKDMHTGLYKNYVESLNTVSAELDTADRSAANPRHSDFKSLKLDEAYNLNAVWLHELYFANCFDPHSEIVMDSQAYLKLQRDFGAFDAWQKDFMATAMAAGNGWAVCGYHMFLRRFVNMIVSHHSGDVMLGVFPVIVVDMWEHSYTRDYLSDKKSYLVSQMKEFNWSVIEERFRRAESIAQAVKS